MDTSNKHMILELNRPFDGLGYQPKNGLYVRVEYECKLIGQLGPRSILSPTITGNIRQFPYLRGYFNPRLTVEPQENSRFVRFTFHFDLEKYIEYDFIDIDLRIGSELYPLRFKIIQTQEAL